MFAEPKNVACEHVVNKKRAINLVTHDREDGQWQFLCGENDHTMENIMLVSLENIVNIDSSINELYDIPLGYGASRNSPTEKWKSFKEE